MSLHPDEERPLELGGVPGQEGVSAADAAERVEDDPEAQPNLTDVEDSPTGHS